MKTKNLMVGVLAAVLVTALWWTVLLKPTRAKAAKAKSDTQNEQSQLAPLQAQLSQAQRDASHAAQFKAELSSLELAMPDSPALAAFIRDANNIALSTGVSWQSVTHAVPTPAADGELSIGVGIQVKGTYAQDIDYMRSLAALKRLVIVDSIQFTTTSSTGTTVGGGGGNAAAESTGPFSGGNQLLALISGRMFESPGGAAPAAGTGTSTAASAGTGVTPGGGAQTSTLNNS